jgi:hypothetical protein
MLPYRDSFLTKVVLAIFFILVVGYAYYEARGIMYGPRITVTSDVHEVNEPYVIISGQAERIAALWMNGQPIAVTEDGVFEEPFLLSPGLNRIVLDAEDRYGRKRQKIVQIVYTGPEGASLIEAATATTTAATTTPATTTPDQASSTDEIAP